MRFGDPDGGIEIASTRPELLAACVGIAVNPKDDKYKTAVGKTITVPIFGQKARIISDDEVDPRYGTGAVMICTFGDKTAVRVKNKYALTIITLLMANA